MVGKANKGINVEKIIIMGLKKKNKPLSRTAKAQQRGKGL